MKKDSYTSHQWAGVFILREQLHGYLDIFEINHLKLSQMLGHLNSSMLLNSKRLMTGLADKQFHEFKSITIVDASIFHPPKDIWLNAYALESNDFELVMGALLTFDKKMMAWCYYFMVHEDSGLELTYFLLKLIEYAKANAEFLLSELDSK